jgi:hypothetical protein
MQLAVLLKKVSFSLIGHVAFFQLIWGIPMFVFSIYDHATLTPSRILWNLFVASMGALFVAVLGWFTISKPIIERRKRGV